MNKSRNASFIAYSLALSVSVLSGTRLCSAQEHAIQLPTPQQVEWSDAEIGVIIHLDINIFAPDTFDDSNPATLPPLSAFNPEKLDTDQWLSAAKAAGAKYAVLVAKHGTGFALWPSKANTYNVGHTPWRNGKADIVADFVASCKRYDIKPGLYYSLNFNTLYASFGRCKDAAAQTAYNEVVLKQLTELWTQYGDLFEIWFDGGVRSDDKGGLASKVTSLVEQHQPKAILFQGPSSCKNLIRWIGNENGNAPYPHWSTSDFTTSSTGVEEIAGLHGNPDGKIWCPGEADFPNRWSSSWKSGWLWRAGQDDAVLPPEALVERYYTSVGRNANMLIGMVIDTSGLFPKKDADAFVAFGKEIKHRFATRIGETKGTGDVIEFSLPGNSKRINHVEIMEDITKGERIRQYKVEGLVNGKWTMLCEGTSVGHKRLQKCELVAASTVRLTVLKSIGPAQIRRLAVYGAEEN